jgi:hypothetical protein
MSRQEAARQCVAVFDTGFFKALCEPARIAVLRELILLGRADIAAIADRLPQDRSVIARHLQQLARGRRLLIGSLTNRGARRPVLSPARGAANAIRLAFLDGERAGKSGLGPAKTEIARVQILQVQGKA